jgi:hypothetical protein
LIDDDNTAGDRTMSRYWLTSAVAFVMMSGVAMAQSAMPESTTSTQSTTTTNSAPLSDSFNATKTKKTIESDGTEIDKSKSYKSDPSGSSTSSSTKVETPDGSQEKSTSTTTINR